MELLVVIAIMSLLALALLPAIRAARDQGDAARCQTRLRNLHQACHNYLSDHEYYPRAGSYERYDKLFKTFSEAKGWVAWLRNDGKEIDPWREDNTESHGEEYYYARWSGKKAEESIRKGVLFKYTGEDLTTYICPRFERKHRYLARDGRLGYAMNMWFYSRRNPNWHPRDLTSFNRQEASRLGLFVEIDKPGEPKSASTVKGEPGNQLSGKRSPMADDSVWDWDKDDLYGATYHRKSGKKHGHIIFVDGHIESLAEGDDVAEKTLEIGEGKH